MKHRYRTIAGGIAVGLVLAGSLSAQSARFDDFPNMSPKADELAPDFALQTLEGETFTLSEAYAKQPIVMEFGSYT